MKTSESILKQSARAGKIALAVGVVAALASVGLAYAGAGWTLFMECYLQAHLFWNAIAVGSLAVLMVHHLCGGEWGFLSQRVLEASSRTIPVAGLLFIPVLLQLPLLYPWSRPDAVAASYHLQHKQLYLNPTFFIVRAVLYYAIWTVMAYLLRSWSLAQDKDGSEVRYRHMRVLSGAGVLIYALTITFASWDWTMSLDPLWFSSMWGPLFLVGQALTTLAFLSIVLTWLSHGAPFHGLIREKHFHSVGNLTFAFVILWAYMSFAQFLIIWSGNLPEEIAWYLKRCSTGWKLVAVGLAAFHFVAPFFLLLSRATKRSSATLWKIAVFVLLVRFVDIHWVVGPNFYGADGEHAAFGVSALNVTLPLALGGLWLALFLRNLRQAPLLPQQDTRFAAFAAGNKTGGHHG